MPGTGRATKVFGGGSLRFQPHVEWLAPRVSDGTEITDDDVNERNIVEFEPLMVIMHRGQHQHEALPLVGGERVNLVVWLFADGGRVRVVPYPRAQQHTVSKVRCSNIDTSSQGDKIDFKRKRHTMVDTK